MTGVLDRFTDDGTDRRGQVGIGTLIVFIAMVLVAAIAAGVLINTAGFLQETSQQTGEESASQVSDGVKVLSSNGLVTAEDVDSDALSNDTNYISRIDLLVKRSSGAGGIDLEDATVEVIGPRGEAVMTATSTDNTATDDANDPAAGEFGLVEVHGSESTGDTPDGILDNDEERVELVLAFNMDTASGTTDATQALEAGDRVTLRVTSASGAQTVVIVNVPEQIGNSDGEYVEV